MRSRILADRLPRRPDDDRDLALAMRDLMTEPSLPLGHGAVQGGGPRGGSVRGVSLWPRDGLLYRSVAARFWHSGGGAVAYNPPQLR